MFINRRGSCAVERLWNEIPADTITGRQTIIRSCKCLPFNDVLPAGNEHKWIRRLLISSSSRSRRNQSEQSLSGFTGSCRVQCSAAWQNFSGTCESLIKSLEQWVDIWSSPLTLTATAWHNQEGRVSFGFRITARLLLPDGIQNLQTSSFYEGACLLCDSVWSVRRYVLSVE